MNSTTIKQINTVIRNLQKRNMGASYFASRQEATAAMLEMIEPGAAVYRGDSMTLEQSGLLDALQKRNQNPVVYPLDIDDKGVYLATREDRYRMAKEAVFADIFLTGVNAIALDGKLVSTDGWGNRVYPLLFGPPKVIVVAGINKIVKDVTAARERISQIAGPVNVKRHLVEQNRAEFGKLPCAVTGKCADCRSDMRICNYTVIIEGAMSGQKGRINVVLIGEELGI